LGYGDQSFLCDAGRIRIGDFQFAEGFGRSGPFLEQKFDMQGFIPLDGDKVKPASPAAKSNDIIGL
jgi:hypothetical protein